MVTFPEVPLGIFLFCMCVITIGAVQVGPPSLPSPPHACHPGTHIFHTCACGVSAIARVVLVGHAVG